MPVVLKTGMRSVTNSLTAVLFTVVAAAQQPLSVLPYTPSLDLNSLNRSVQPCENFYQFACGNWIRNNPIPADQPRWDVYGKLTFENQLYLWSLLLEAGNKPSGRTPNEQKIGDMFASCMDEAAVTAAAAKPVQPLLDNIAALKSVNDLPVLLARLHLGLSGDSMLFDFGANQDFSDSSRVIAFASAGGLGLPDRDYYTKDDAKSVEIRQKYVAHIAHLLHLSGDTDAAAQAGAQAILRLETAHAKATLTRVEQRDPYKLLHRMSAAELRSLTPSFNWDAYFRALGQQPGKVINVTQPAFFTELDKQLKTASLGDLKTYLRWHALHAKAATLSPAFVDADFDFYSKTLRGTPSIRPRWKRCVQIVDRLMGEALGEVFVSKTFTPETRARTVAMTQGIEDAMKQEIDALDWMSPATKKQAFAKLRGIANKVGYPEKWRDYSKLEIRQGDYYGNVERAVEFESRRQLAKIGKPVDRSEWDMSPPTVNAYYNPQMNDINFPAGVLQPPLFDPKMDDAPNFGNTGATIGHELTHGFDDEGRQFDAKGNLKDWWTKQDAAEFEKRAQCVVDQYAQYTIVDDIKINSKLTLGEDVADLGGQLLAYIAWKAANKGKSLTPVDGFTPDQRFFIGMAQWACGSDRPENLRVSALTNPHSPNEYRINGVVANMPQFQEAFSCKLGQPMVREKACKVW